MEPSLLLVLGFQWRLLALQRVIAGAESLLAADWNRARYSAEEFFLYVFPIQELPLEACWYQGAENSKPVSITVAFYRSPFSSDRKQQEWIFAGNLEWLLMVLAWFCSFWWEILLFSLQFMASSGHAAMATAVQGSQWSSSCSRSSTATRPSPSLGHTTVSALVPWVSTQQGTHWLSFIHSGSKVFSAEVIKMLSHETLGHNELKSWWKSRA